MSTINLRSRAPDYSDLDLDFIRKPGTGDISKKLSEEAIKRSIRNLVLTNHYERPFRSFIGSNVQKLLFENLTPITANLLIRAITEVIENFEPRARLLEVQVNVNFDNNGYDARITFTPINKIEPVVTSLFLERVR